MGWQLNFMNLNAPDLTKRPPRSPRARLGGFAMLPRMLDKGRAALANSVGEFHYNCPLDQHFLNFVGVNADDLKEQLASGKGDGEILEWIKIHATRRPSVTEIAAWSVYQEQRAPSDPDSRQHFNDLHAKTAPQRDDISTWFDLLDVDDHVTFGGKP